MPHTIQQIQKEKKEIIESMLDVKVFKKICDNAYIVYDATAHALLETSQELKEGMVYKLLKPKFINKIFEANPKLKILKSNVKLDTRTFTKLEMKHYEGSAEVLNQNLNTGNKGDMNNFTKCEALNENNKIEMLTVLIVSKSRYIEGQYGKYNIVTAKDCESNKNSINIYHDKSRMVEAEKMLTFTTLKKTTYKQVDGDYHRLATMWSTRIFEAKEKDKLEFKDVLLGDEKITGKVLGYDDLSIYESCKKCLSKVVDGICRKCQRNVEEKKTNDFYVTLFVQDIKDENNIMSLFAFKKDLNIVSEETEEFEKILDEVTDKTYVIEFNKPEGDEKIKLVKIQKK